jgi:hypothetical protein
MLEKPYHAGKSAMISIEHRVGRLIEVRFAAPLKDDELDAFAQDRGRVVRTVAAERVVCIDSTRLSVLPPEQSERMLGVLRRPSPGLLRSAFLLPQGRAVMVLQFERLIREARNVASRAFTQREPLVDWLRDVITLAEETRLIEFLDEQNN